MERRLPRLATFGENSGNALRFLTGGETGAKKSRLIWKLGPGNSRPKKNIDWKEMTAPRGGGRDRKSYHVQKSFLKRVALARYRVQLLRS